MYLYYIYLCVSVCGEGVHTCHSAHVKARGQRGETVISFHHVGPRDQT